MIRYACSMNGPPLEWKTLDDHPTNVGELAARFPRRGAYDTPRGIGP